MSQRMVHVQEAAELTRIASRILEREAQRNEPDEDERALWRLVDAAGKLMAGMGRREYQTGLGFRLVDIRASAEEASSVG